MKGKVEMNSAAEPGSSFSRIPEMQLHAVRDNSTLWLSRSSRVKEQAVIQDTQLV